MANLIKFSRKKAAKHPGALWDALDEFLAFANINDLTPVQRVAHLAEAYSRAVFVTGHREYFLNSDPTCLDETVAALRTIGVTPQADILTAAMREVSNARDCAPAQYENRQLAGIEFADLTEFDNAFERCTRSVDDALTEYYAKHESEFVDWKP